MGRLIRRNRPAAKLLYDIRGFWADELLINGRLSPSTAIAADRLAVEGDAAVAADFGQWFKGI